MQKHNPSERGQALVIVAFGLIAMIALTALSVDGGNAYSDRRHAQNSADASAMAAALAMVRPPSTTDNAFTIGFARAAENGYDNNGTSNTVEFYSPPTTGLYACNGAEGSIIIPETDPAVKACTQYIQVFITSHVKTWFAPMVGITQVTNKVEAVARVIGSTTQPVYEGSAIASMDPDACKSLEFQGSAEVKLTGSGIYVNSDCTDEAFFNQSRGGSLTAPCLIVVGGIRDTSAVQIPPGCKLENQSPKPGPSYPNIVCATNAKQTGDTMSPGNWDGGGNKDFPPRGVKHLLSGTYCLTNADFVVNANDQLDGHDIVIYMVDGGVTWNGGSSLALDAPGGDANDCDANAGPFKGLLMYVDKNNHSAITINGGTNTVLTGTILAPGADCTLAGGGTVSAPLQMQLVCGNVKLTGNSGTYINYDPCVAFEPPTMPLIQLAK
jgi:Flp pilus assembly protein TadG